MYINKDELIKRLSLITGKSRGHFLDMSVNELTEMYKRYVAVGEKIYISVPYKERKLAQLFGAQYDGEKKSWYIPLGVDVNHFERWMKGE